MDYKKIKKDQLIELIGELASDPSKVEEIKKQAENASQEIEKFRIEANNKNENISELWREMNDQKTSVVETKEQAKNASQEIRDTLSEIKIKKEDIDNLLSEYQKVYEECREKKAEIASLEKIIRKLLPGATTAGLAGSYIDAQKKGWRIGLYWGGFIGSLGLLLCILGGEYYPLLSEQESISLGAVFIRFTLSLPLVWIAWYCQRSISQTKRVKEEYQHKERIMKVYPAFMKQLSEGGAEGEKSEFVKTIIKAIAKNPAEVLNPSKTFIDLDRKKDKTE